jgi:DNA-binding transcriptional regulator YiaG
MVADAGQTLEKFMNAAKKEVRKPIKPTKVIRDAVFAKRLETAMDGNPHCPAYNHGRLTWVRDQFKDRFKTDLTIETVRKWASGEARPRPNKMKLLARLLEADEAWLSLGIAPEMDVRAREKRNVALSGAASVVMGLVQMDGGVTAFPGDKDPRGAVVDFYAIIKGAQYAVHTALAQHMEGNSLKFVVPTDFEQCTLIGIVKNPGMRLDLLELPTETVAKNQARKGGFGEIEVYKRGEEYLLDGSKLPKIKSFAERL